MANNAFRNPANTAVAQVWKGTITTTTNGHTYVVTITDDDGTTAAITYTVANPPDTTTTLVATGFITAWNASSNPLVSRITATQSSGQVILTADTAGIPFSVATSGTGTWSGTGNTTSNVGNNDYGTARNWQLDLVPVATDDVIIDSGDSGTSSVDLLYSLNQSSVAIADFRVLPGYSGNIGRFTFGLPHYLRIDPDLFRYEGSGALAMFNIGSANIDCYINSTGKPTTQRYSTYLKGSNIATCYVQRGVVGIAPLDEDTATVATLNVGYVDNQAGDSKVTVGTGVTLTTLSQTAGFVELRCAATTVNCGYGSSLLTRGSGAVTTMNVYGTAVLDSTGTITTLNVYGTVDFSRSRAARTVTTLNVFPGAKVILGSWITLTNKITPPSTGAGIITIEMRT